MDMKSVKIEESLNAETAQAEPEAQAIPFNPLSILNERQRIALASKWAALKQSERDSFSEYSAAGVTDSATLYVIRDIITEANNKIFSDSRAQYLGTMIQWYLSLTSKEAQIKKYAETELMRLFEQTNGGQQLTLLSALKDKLLSNRTFLPEIQDIAFAAMCRLWGFEKGQVK